MIPANTKLESQFLGGLLINPHEFKYIQELFHEELFYDEKNQLIAKAILGLNNASKTIDIVNVSNQLESTLKINPISFYDLSLLTNDCILNRFDEKILILNEFYIKRKMMFKLSELLEKTQDSTSDVFELLADNEKNTNEIFNKIKAGYQSNGADDDAPEDYGTKIRPDNSCSGNGSWCWWNKGMGGGYSKC